MIMKVKIKTKILLIVHFIPLDYTSQVLATFDNHKFLQFDDFQNHFILLVPCPVLKRNQTRSFTCKQLALESSATSTNQWTTSFGFVRGKGTIFPSQIMKGLNQRKNCSRLIGIQCRLAIETEKMAFYQQSLQSNKQQKPTKRNHSSLNDLEANALLYLFFLFSNPPVFELFLKIKLCIRRKRQF